MSLSVVITNSNQKDLIKLLEKLFIDYNSRNIEVVVVSQTGTNVDMAFELFEEQRKQARLKFVFSSIEDRFKAEINAISFATGTHLLFLTSSSSVKKGFVENVVNIVMFQPAIDILEVDVKVTGHLSTKWSSDEITPNVEYDASKSPTLLGFTSPFIFNKVIRKGLIEYIFSRESIPLEETISTYILLRYSKSYIYSTVAGLTYNVPNDIESENRLSQWDYLLKYFKSYTDWNITKSSIEYAYVKYMVTFFSNLTTLDLVEQEKLETVIKQRLQIQLKDLKYNKYIKNNKKLLSIPVLKNITVITNEQSIELDELTKETKVTNRRKLFVKN